MSKKSIVLFLTVFAVFFALAQTRSEKPAEIRYSNDIAVSQFYPADGADGFYRPEQKITLSITLKNNTANSIAGKISCTVRDFFGKNAAAPAPVNFTVSPESKATVRLAVPPPGRNGYFIAEALISGNGKDILKTQSAFSVIQEIQGKRDPFFSMDRNNLTEKLIEGYKAIGLGRVTIYEHEGLFISNYLKKSKNMSEAVSKLLASPKWSTFLNSDFELAANIGYDNLWGLYRNRMAAGLPIINDDIVRFCASYSEELAKKTKGRINLYICNNEIDAHVKVKERKIFGSPVEIIANSVILVRTIYQGIKRGNPNAKVAVLGIFGGDYYNYPPGARFPISKMYLDGLGENFDLVCIDAYNGNWNGIIAPLPQPETGLRNYLVDSAGLSASYRRPATVLNAERAYQLGYSDAFDSDLSKQIAAFTARSMIITRSTPASLYTIHYAADNPLNAWRLSKRLDNTHRTGDMGVWKSLPDYDRMDLKFVPRPTAAAIAVAARKLAFASGDREIIRGNTLYCYTFKKKDGSAVAAFYSIGNDSEIQIQSEVPLSVCDMTGDETTLKPGKNVLTLTGAPIYVSGNLDPKTLGGIFESAKLLSFEPVSLAARISGKSLIRVYYRNNENSLLKGKFVSGKQKWSIHLPPGMLRTVDLTNVSPDSLVLKIDDGRSFNIPVDTESYTVKPAASKPRLDGSGSWLPETPSGTLGVPADVWPKSEVIPEAGNFKFDGSDIKADYYFKYDADNFYFAVKVHDKTHLQRQTGVHVWMEDMLQFAFTTRDLPPKKIRGKSVSTPFDDHEFCYALALTPGGEEFQRWSGGKYPGGPCNLPHSVKRKGNITFYEAAIPWSELGIKPKKGAGIRFGFIIQDNNLESEKKGRYHLAFSGGIFGTQNQDSSCFKTLVLE